MQFGLDIAQHQLTWEEILDRARLAESAGFDGAWVFDHFKPLYADPAGPCLEGWSLLAALAAATERVRLGALVTGVTYRHPAVLAAQAVTVDHVSGGRLELGMGAAWFEREHRELGIGFPAAGERRRRLEEAVQVLRLLMTGDEASFEGRHYRLRGATYRPRPVQRPHPPIWIGARGERMLAVVGRRADVWHAFGRIETIRSRWDLVRRHAESAGRDASSIRRATSLSLSQPWDDVRREAEAFAGAGVDYLVVEWPSEGRAHLDEFVSSVMPDLGGL